MRKCNFPTACGLIVTYVLDRRSPFALSFLSVFPPVGQNDLSRKAGAVMLELHCFGSDSNGETFSAKSKLVRWRVRSFSDTLDLAAAIRSDVFIADATMPNWREALRDVRRVKPDVIRVLLNSDSPDQEFSDLSLFHRIVDRRHPACIDELAQDVVHARSLVEDRDVRQALLEIDALPSHSDLYGLASQPSCQAETRKHWAQRDVALAAALLKHQGGPRDAQISPGDYAETLTPRQWTELVQIVSERVSIPGFDVDHFHTESTRAADLARDVGRHCRQPDRDCNDFQLAGLIHDIGRLALAVIAPDEYGQLHLLADQLDRSLWQVERRVMGIDHMQAGVFLASVWAMPTSVREAAQFHHEPRRGRRHDGLSALSAVYAADACLHQELDTDHCYLQDAGLDRALDQLRSMQPNLPRMAS